MEFQIFIVSVIFCVFVKWLMDIAKTCRALPPGPWGVPVLGYLPWISNKPHEKFCQLASKYGSVFSVKMGSETVVVLNDWPSIREALVDQPQVFNGRPKLQSTFGLTKNKDVVFADGPVWKKQRSLMIRCLRNIGMGKKSMESRAMDMVHNAMDTLSKHDGGILNMESLIFTPLLKFNWNMVSDAVIEDINVKEFEILMTWILANSGSDNPINVLPWLRFVPPNGFGYWESIRLNEKLLSYLQSIIDQHLANWNEGALIDFVDFYLAEIKAHNNNKLEVPDDPPFNVDHLLMSLWDVFLAGVNTTNTVCLWGFLFLAYHPEVQQKAQAEMERVVGRDRLPTLNDFPRLPYVAALIMEIHRKASVGHLTVHKTTSTGRVSGYTIPKDTTVIQNIYAVHHDPTLWDQPEIFNPDRFLNENNVTKTPLYLMPFSIGPRVCLGQSIADIELKLIFSCLLHRFSFSLPPDRPKPTLEPKVRLSLQPHPYSLAIRMRKSYKK